VNERLPYVDADKMPIQGVTYQGELCFKVSGKQEDLHGLAMQIKSKYVAPVYTVVLVSGKQWTDEPSELIISGNINLPDDNAYRLVEQRISEGLPVEIVYGRYYRNSYVYSYSETSKPE
jgi:hypothetical protein